MTLSPPDYRPRYADSKIRMMLKAFGGVCVEGPKFCGKTWTSLNVAESVFNLNEADGDFQNYKLATADVNYALEGKAPHLIDEWQTVPSIWDAVRNSVDKTAENGRFILTGSSTPIFKGVMHSGAGRIGNVRMRPMSLYESGDSSGNVSLMDLFDGSMKTTGVGDVTLDDLIYLTVRGGWPRNIGLDAELSSVVNSGYLGLSILDASKMDGILRNPEKIRMTVRSLARNESTLAKDTKIFADVEDTSPQSIKEYMGTLERLFLVDNQPAFDPNYRSKIRVGKQVKRHLVDPALAVSALNLNDVKLKKDIQTFGFLFESLAERDLRIYAESVGGELLHYHDSRDNEIDAIIELRDGRWGAFEIKLGTGQIDEAAANLLRIDEMMASAEVIRPSVLCVVCGLSSYAYRREDGVYVVPLTALRGAELSSHRVGRK